MSGRPDPAAGGARGPATKPGRPGPRPGAGIPGTAAATQGPPDARGHAGGNEGTGSPGEENGAHRAPSDYDAEAAPTTPRTAHGADVADSPADDDAGALGDDDDTAPTTPRTAGTASTAGAPADDDDDAGAPGTIMTDVAALAAERDDYLQALQRLKADFDNYRKRVARLQEEQAARAAASLVEKLLPVLDNLDLALAHLVGDVPATEDARALTQSRVQLLDVLAREGLERVDATEVAFDPTVHDAVAHAPAPEAAEPEEAAAADGTVGPGGSGASGNGAAGEGQLAAGAHEVVDDVMRAGYRWRGQVLRPAMVRVRG